MVPRNEAIVIELTMQFWFVKINMEAFEGILRDALKC